MWRVSEHEQVRSVSGVRGRRRSPAERLGWKAEATGRGGEAQSPALPRGVCTQGPGPEHPLPRHTCLSRSLWVTPWDSVTKWGGAKLRGSSVSLWWRGAGTGEGRGLQRPL